MNIRTKYRGYIINSAPLPLREGGFSSNGAIEYHTGSEVIVYSPHDLQAILFETEEETHNYYVEKAKKIIDESS